MGINDVEVPSAGGSYIKTPVGMTRVRIVSSPIKVWKNFDDKVQYLTTEAAAKDPKASLRYSMYAIERLPEGQKAQEEVKILEIGAGLMQDLKDMANNPEYKYEGLPPYDITINRTGTGRNDTRYTAAAARTNTELTDVEKKMIAAQQDMTMFLREKAADKSDVAPF